MWEQMQEIMHGQVSEDTLAVASGRKPCSSPA